MCPRRQPSVGDLTWSVVASSGLSLATIAQTSSRCAGAGHLRTCGYLRIQASTLPGEHTSTLTCRLQAPGTTASSLVAIGGRATDGSVHLRVHNWMDSGLCLPLLCQFSYEALSVAT